MLKVFKVWCVDTSDKFEEEYRDLLLDRRVYKTEAERYEYRENNLYFMGVRKKNWVPPQLMSRYPLRPEPDFWNFGFGAFAVGEKALYNSSELERMLEDSGQLLPLPYNGQELKLVNILECVECIDKEKTEWNIHPRTAERVTARRPFFAAEDLPESTLFKIPQQPMDVYAWELHNDPEFEFKACVEENKFTGIYFEPVWSEESGIIPPQR